MVKINEDPFTNSVSFDKASKAKPINNVPCNHRTLTIINISYNSSPSQKERAIRLVNCLNTEMTIKSDVVTVSDGLMYNGLVFIGTSPGGLKVEPVQGKHEQVVEVTYI